MDRVAVLLPDGIDGQVAYYALAKSGLVRASLNVRDTAEDREFRLQHSGSRALISDRFRALAALAVPCVVIVAVIVSSSGISHRPGHGGNHPGLADATEGAKQGPRLGAGKEPGWSAPARAETNTTSCATVLLSTAVAIRCRKWDARSARNQCHAFGVVVARNAFTTKITLAGPCVIRPHRNSSSASETACLEFTTQNQDVSVPGHRRHPRGHLRGVVEANCSAQLRIRLASATARLGWMFRVPRGGRRRSTRQCPIFASLPVTSTGRGHGSVAAGVGDGPGGSGLGRADGVSPGRACG